MSDWMIHAEWVVKPHGDGYVVTERFNDMPPMAPCYFDQIEHATAYIEQQQKSWQAVRDQIAKTAAGRLGDT